jgi:hypothetical protein
VPAIGEQRHRVERPPGDDFDHHHRQRDPHHGPRAALARFVSRVETVVVRPLAQVVGMHRSLPG